MLRAGQMGEFHSPQIRPQESGFQAGPELEFIPVIPALRRQRGRTVGYRPDTLEEKRMSAQGTGPV